ncbi:MAG: hypothetical protein ACOX5C_06550 [Acutalibacteraceae bacterium]|jgi:hypothetical protein
MNRRLQVFTAVLLFVSIMFTLVSCGKDGQSTTATTVGETSEAPETTEGQTAMPVEAKPFTNFSRYLTRIDFSYPVIEIAEMNATDLFLTVPANKNSDRANSIVRYRLGTGKTQRLYTVPDRDTVISDLQVNDEYLLYVTSREDLSRQRIYIRNLETGSTRQIYSATREETAVTPILFNHRVFWIEKRSGERPVLCEYDAKQNKKTDLYSLSSRRAESQLSFNEGRLLYVDYVAGSTAFVIYDVINAAKTVIPTGSQVVKDAMLAGKFLIYSQYEGIKTPATTEKKEDEEPVGEQGEVREEPKDEEIKPVGGMNAWSTCVFNIDTCRYFSGEESDIFFGFKRVTAGRFAAVLKTALRFYMAGENRISYLFTLPERSITYFSATERNYFIVTGEGDESGSFVIIVNMNGYFEKI